MTQLQNYTCSELMSMNSCDLGVFKNGMEIHVLYNFFIYRRIKHFDKRLYCFVCIMYVVMVLEPRPMKID